MLGGQAATRFDYLFPAICTKIVRFFPGFSRAE